VLATPTTPGYTDSTAAPGVTYYYIVTASVSGITSLASNEVSAQGVFSVPAAARLVSARPGNGEVTLSWRAVAGATGYAVYQGTAPGGEGGTAVATVTATSIAIKGLTNGKTYYFKVAATNSVGAGALSNERSAEPKQVERLHRAAEPQAFSDQLSAVSETAFTTLATFLTAARSTINQVGQSGMKNLCGAQRNVELVVQRH
jgi:hypothetical protein